MANVLEVKQNPKKPENGFVKLDDGQDCWTPSFEKAQAALTVGQPLPEGWEINQGEYGPRLFPPKERKGGGFGAKAAAWANTAEGAAFVQERTDRRTSLMQAVATAPSADISWVQLADDYYKWLRASAANPPAPSASAETGVAPLPRPVSASTSAAYTGEGVGATADSGRGSENRGEAASGPCSHPSTSPLKLDGQALPKGYVRCVECNALSDKQGVFK